jgi:hypothetical protein
MNMLYDFGLGGIDLNGRGLRTSFARVRARVLVAKLRTGLRTAR